MEKESYERYYRGWCSECYEPIEYHCTIKRRVTRMQCPKCKVWADVVGSSPYQLSGFLRSVVCEYYVKLND